MAGIFELTKTNFVGYFNPANCSVEQFTPWIKFLNEHSLVSTAITLNTPLKVDSLRALYSSAWNSSLVNLVRFSFRIGQNEYMVDENDVNRILCFPTGDFEPLPTTPEVITFFQFIEYQSDINLVRMSKSQLVSEWNYVFDILAKVFSPTTKNNFHNISSLLQNIGYAVAHNTKINFGKLILIEIIRKMGTSQSRDLNQNRKVTCYYPRFLMLFLNDKLKDEDKALFANSPAEESPATSRNLFTMLKNKNKFEGVAVRTTQFMVQMFNQAANPQPTQPEQQSDQLLLEAAHHMEEETRVNQDIGYEPENTQVLTQAIGPQTASSSQTLSQTRKGRLPVRRRRDRIQVGTMSKPAALSTPHKRTRIEPETTTTLSVFSQKDMDREMAMKQSLDSFSQKDDSIEIRRPAAVPCDESSTLLAITLVEPANLQITEVEKSMDPAHINAFENIPIDSTFSADEDMFDYVQNPMPSQVSEGKSNSLPPILELFSPLPGGSFLAPLRDFPLVVSTGESGRQLVQSTTEAIQLSIQNDQVDLIEDWDLRTPIAPPLTSSTGAMVIFNASTAMITGSELNTSIVRQTPSDTPTREESELNKSEGEVSAHTNTDLLMKMDALQKEMQVVQAELAKRSTKADLGSTSASLTEPLTIARDEVNSVKSNILLNTKDIQDIQSLIVEDMKGIRDVNVRLDELEKSFNDRIIENEEISTRRFNKLDQGMLHLNEGMKKVHQTIENFTKSFQTSKSVEDPSTKGEKSGGAAAASEGEEREKGKAKLTYKD